MAIQSNQRDRITVVVAGDSGTGKSSLIAAAVSKKCPSKAPPVLPPNHLPADFFREHVPCTIIDTPSGPENFKKRERAEAFRLADVVVLTFAHDRLYTFDNLRSYWLPELCRLKVKVPIVIAGCKAELVDKFDAEQIKALFQEEFHALHIHVDCSVYRKRKVSSVFNYALQAVLYPVAPLYDKKTQNFTHQCFRALCRIFICCDLDHDGALNDAELNESQVTSSNAPLKPSEIVAFKRAVQDKFPEGVNERGLTATDLYSIINLPL